MRHENVRTFNACLVWALLLVGCAGDDGDGAGDADDGIHDSDADADTDCDADTDTDADSDSDSDSETGGEVCDPPECIDWSGCAEGFGCCDGCCVSFGEDPNCGGCGRDCAEVCPGGGSCQVVGVCECSS